MPMKWDEEKWKNDQTWWTPFNKIGRLKGKGTTSWSRQQRRANETPEEREERKKKRDEKKLLEKEQQEATSKEPLEKIQEEKSTESKDSLEKREEATSSKDSLEKIEEEKSTESKDPVVKKEEKASTKQSVEPSKEEPVVKKDDEADWVLVANKKRSKQWIKKGEQLWESKPLETKHQEQKPLKEVARRKLDEGYVSKTGTSSSSSSSIAPEALAKKLPRHKDGTKLAIDWHATFEIKVDGTDQVPSSHVRGLWDLQEAGYRTILLSFCGKRREEEVKQKLYYLPCRFEEAMFTRSRTGRGGKVEQALENCINIIIDDNADIIYEAWQHGKEVMPIKTNCQWSARWYREQGIYAYESFEEVANYLAKFTFQ